MPRPTRPAGPAPGRAELHNAALRYLARYAASEAGLVRVLERRIRRWADAAGGEAEAVAGAQEMARTVARALVSAGLVDDAAFAQARSARLSRAGRSRRAVAAHLVGKGIEAGVVAAVLPDAADELAAGLAYARRRRIGAFRGEAAAENRLRDLGAFARAGFSRETAERVLSYGAEEAKAEIVASRRRSGG